MRYELENRMKKNFQYFVILFIVSSSECKHQFPRRAKNEIYFTLDQVLQSNGFPKIKLIFPQTTSVSPQTASIFPQKTSIFSQKTSVFPETTSVFSATTSVFSQRTTKENRNSKIANNYILKTVNHADNIKSEDSQIDYYLGLDLKKLNTNSELVNSNKIVNGYHKHDGTERRNKTKLFRRRSNLRFKKEVISRGQLDFIPVEYRYQDPITGSYSFGYRTEDQYREELRTVDGVVYGNFGWMDQDGKWHHTTFVADQNGYRISPPRHQVSSYPASGLLHSSMKTHGTTKAPLHLATQSSYEFYNSSNIDRYSAVNPYQVKEGYKETKYGEGGQTKYGEGGQTKYGEGGHQYGAGGQHQHAPTEEPLLSNLKEKLNLIPPSNPNTMYGVENKKEISSYGSHGKDTPSLTVQSSIKNIYSPLNRGPQKPQKPTKEPYHFKPTTQGTITVTNLQDSFFNKLPLKPLKDLSPKLEKPMKQYSTTLTKWPDIKWLDNADDLLAPLLQSLGTLTGRSNSFSNLDILNGDSFTDDNSKKAKSIYESIANQKTFTSNSNKRKRNPLTRLNKPAFYHLRNFKSQNDSVIPLPYIQNYGDSYLPLSPIKSLKKYTISNIHNPSILHPDKEYVLFFPFPLEWNHDPFRTPSSYISYWNRLIPANNIFFLYPLHAQPYPYEHPIINTVSTNSPGFSISPPKAATHSDIYTNTTDDVDYLLLSDEFEVINGSITNDPAFGSILDHQSNITENNKTETTDQNNSLDTFTDSDPPTEPSINDETSESLASDEENIKITKMFTDNEDDTHNEIQFRLSIPLLRKDSPIVRLNKN